MQKAKLQSMQHKENSQDRLTLRRLSTFNPLERERKLKEYSNHNMYI